MIEGSFLVENLSHCHMILTINNTILETRYNLNARKKIIYLRSYKAGFNFLKWAYVTAISFICSECRQQFPEHFKTVDFLTIFI